MPSPTMASPGTSISETELVELRRVRPARCGSAGLECGAEDRAHEGVVVGLVRQARVDVLLALALPMHAFALAETAAHAVVYAAFSSAPAFGFKLVSFTTQPSEAATAD